jgi:hypothetical protein
LNSKNIVQNERLTKASFDWLIGEIKERFRSSLVNPGEMVGVLELKAWENLPHK